MGSFRDKKAKVEGEQRNDLAASLEEMIAGAMAEEMEKALSKEVK